MKTTARLFGPFCGTVSVRPRAFILVRGFFHGGCAAVKRVGAWGCRHKHPSISATFNRDSREFCAWLSTNHHNKANKASDL